MFEEKIFWKEGFEGKCMGGMMFKFDGNNVEVITSAEKK